MAKKVLFVVEGGKDENNLIIKAFKRVMELSKEDVVVVRYKTVIYDLYDRLSSGEYDSLVDYLWVCHRNIFKGEFAKPRDCFSSIYLIFDFDSQDQRFSIDKCEWLIRYFSDETKNGKLYFNYPMVESLLDFNSFSQNQFNNKTVSRKNLKGDTYKKKVAKNSLIMNNLMKYSLKNNKILHDVIFLHLNKYEYLCGVSINDPVIDSLALLNAELIFYRNNKVSIINSSILLLCDYNIDIIKGLSGK